MPDMSDQIFQVIELEKENQDGKMILGCSVGGGIDQDEYQNPFSKGDSGIFVSKIRRLSPADKAGLEVGDKIVEVNGKQLTKISHENALKLLTNDAEEFLELKVMRNMVTDDPRLMMKRAAVEFKVARSSRFME
ncbi:Oidioi.mRNA.OKI2018_I69.chr2.g4666.t1.cds [Oikopleura dioica]|uniref:Oidioi.mRNA.OKI2018_I69.chr2.g4666.t1.cds n=1 Tax=Oikopleura dioica TaxID=34765 RepID=A0ABN7SY55_OIKDI|nr:Oidioi.mRNA.OKI2018_I69.chr2.g4666.t1.cds [Oikopleura dioica]